MSAIRKKGCVAWMTPGPAGPAPALTDEQALELAALALRIEAYAGMPQDIEWAIDPAGEIVLLQCRPLQVTSDHRLQLLVPMASGGLPPELFHGGMTASPGVASGPVHRVTKEVDALPFQTVRYWSPTVPWRAGPRCCPGQRQWSAKKAASPAIWPMLPGNSGCPPCSAPPEPSAASTARLTSR
jgi:hypothetical protein